MSIRALRDAKGWSQKQLACASGVSQTYISQLEARKYQPTVAILRKLAKALDVPASRLLDDNEDEMAAAAEPAD